MRVWTTSFEAGGPIPDRHAFCRIADDPAAHVALSDNVNPHVAWSDLPAGTRSLALVVHDDTVPTVGDDVNVEGRTVSAALPRADFFHWVLVDIDPGLGEIPEGAHADRVTPGGKPGPDGPGGSRHGSNSYTQWFAGDPDMGGHYFGYDGPAPPWNDELVHHYHWTVYALDVARLDLPEHFDGPTVRAAVAGHVLAEASFDGTYTLNPALR